MVVDIKNAFILAMKEKLISGYLIGIVSNYLNNRSIIIIDKLYPGGATRIGSQYYRIGKKSLGMRSI